MSWTTSTEDLRKLLADESNQKLAWRKVVFGDVDGVNKTFKTFEYRRITDFSSSDTAAPLGVFVNGVQIPVATDYPDVGEFVVSQASDVAEGVTIGATYYVQWFLDSELDTYILNGIHQVSMDQVENVPFALRNAVLQYAAGDSYSNLALRYTRVMGDHYRVNDLPREYAQEMAERYRTLAKEAYELAQKLRDDYYTRQGQSLQPLFATVLGAAPNPQPKR